MSWILDQWTEYRIMAIYRKQRNKRKTKETWAKQILKRRNKEKAPLKTVNQLNLISKPNPLSKLWRTILASSLRIATNILEQENTLVWARVLVWMQQEPKPHSFTQNVILLLRHYRQPLFPVKHFIKNPHFWGLVWVDRCNCFSLHLFYTYSAGVSGVGSVGVSTSGASASGAWVSSDINL